MVLRCVLINRKEPQKLGALGPRPLGVGAWLTLGALKMQDRKMQDQIAGDENAGPENGGPSRNAASLCS